MLLRAWSLLSRPVSDSPTICSLARRQILLTFLAERENESDLLYPGASTLSPPPKKKTLQDADSLLFGVVYRTYIFSVKFHSPCKQHAKV